MDPFGGEIHDGKIYGRGTCDMKSGVAAMMAAMIGLKRSGASFNGEIIFHRGAIPTVIFGPGNEKFAHKADECVEIEKLVASVPVFMSIFHKLLG